MINIVSKCPDCDAELLVGIGQKVVNEELAWYCSVRCSNCGLAIEEDGGELPEHMRKEFIRQEGLWGLAIEPSKQRALAYKIIRESMGLSLSDIADMIRSEKGIISGTKVETELLRNKLKKVGITAIMERKR